jgi:phosphorylase/glycogen(starch) synthase
MSGLDLTVFPSYYEPWGYTPLESVAFGVPTLTTSLAGFGLWVRSHYKGEHPGIAVVDRDDDNYDQVVAAVKARILEMAGLDKETRLQYMENAREVSRIALWQNQIVYYQQAYSLAIDKVVSRMGEYPSLK